MDKYPLHDRQLGVLLAVYSLHCMGKLAVLDSVTQRRMKRLVADGLLTVVRSNAGVRHRYQITPRGIAVVLGGYRMIKPQLKPSVRWWRVTDIDQTADKLFSRWACKRDVPKFDYSEWRRATSQRQRNRRKRK